MKKVLSFLSLSFLITLAACNRTTENITPQSQKATQEAQSQSAPINDYLCQSQTSPFMAGQNTEVGNITVSSSPTTVYVTFTTNEPWVMGKTHLYVGSLEGMPKAPNGNPKIGNFPYKATYSAATNSYTYAIPSYSLPQCFIVAAHAEVSKLGANGGVVQRETAWGAGVQMNVRGSWASYINYCNYCNGGGETKANQGK